MTRPPDLSRRCLVAPRLRPAEGHEPLGTVAALPAVLHPIAPGGHACLACAAHLLTIVSDAPDVVPLEDIPPPEPPVMVRPSTAVATIPLESAAHAAPRRSRTREPPPPAEAPPRGARTASPDGTREVFEGTDDGGLFLATHADDGTRVARLTEPPPGVYDAAPCWPAERDDVVYFVSGRFGQREPWAVAPDGTGLRQVQVTHGAGGELVGDLAASPDGGALYYARDNGDGTTRHVALDVATGVERADDIAAAPAADAVGP